MNNDESQKIIICSVGLTANGKTTIMRKIASNCVIPFFSEGSIKRNMVSGDFTVKNSVDEELRSKGYREAIRQAFDCLEKNNAVAIDASFHQLFRRLWIYDEIEKRGLSAEYTTVIWIYCICEDEKIIANRIQNRFNDPIKTADNQANTFDVYLYTKNSFDAVKLDDFQDLPRTYIITYSSLNSKIKSVVVNKNIDINSIWDIEINGWRKLWENYM